MKRSAIVTGSAGGIGTAICGRLRSDGLRVVGLDVKESASADESVTVDLSDLAQLETVGRALAERDPSAYAFVHCAAVQYLGEVGALGHDRWSRTMNVNVGALEVLSGCLRGCLTENGGAIVAVGSVHARASTPSISAYATSKAAMEAWVRGAALDLAPEVRVNAVSPGAINTEKLREGFARWGEEGTKRLDVLRSRTPLRRVGAASEVASAVSFLLSDDASFITGATLAVDGGAAITLGTE